MHLKTDTSSQAHFAAVPTISRSRNAFSVAEKHVTTMQFDYLYPLNWKYVYPGDTINVTQHVMARLQTQIQTLYDDLYFDLHAWFVPMRLIQENWARYQFNAQPAGPSQDNSSLTSPKITLSGLGAGGFVAKSLYDYIGMPTKVNLSADTEHINNYIARAYALIWNENYRDENLQNPTVCDLDDGPDNPADYPLLKRGRRHDRFSSMLTAQQKGTAATIPLGSTAPVIPNGTIGPRFTAPTPGNGPWSMGTASSTTAMQYNPTPNVSNTNTVYWERTGLLVDLNSASSATVNAWRTSVAVQHLLEADARGGTRDVEAIQHRWGVTVPDFRMQRPEYLGGQTFTFDGHVVPQTSATAGSSYQARLSQFSQAMSSFGVTHSFVEHGVFLILISARSNVTYQEGLLRELSYRTRYDWYQPEFSNLGEVAVKNKEWYMQGTSADNDTAGFQEYGYELRFGMNKVTGEMRSNYATSLDSKHMADDYSSLPTLGSAWIQSNTPISRNIAVSAATADPIEINSIQKGFVARTLPMYSIPGLSRL